MPSDLEIAHSVTPRPITDVAADLGLAADDLELYGRDKAKISQAALERLLAPSSLTGQGARGLGSVPRGKLILVTAVTPTPAGAATMPGLPKHLAAVDIDVNAGGRITGLF